MQKSRSAVKNVPADVWIDGRGRLRKVRLRLGSGSAASPRGSVAFEHFDLALQAGAYDRATR
jgi:hypothetical protein